MMDSPTQADILSIRDASRRMVRLLGFMRPTLAGTDLSPSAVHALIEIGRRGHLTASQLGLALLLEKSSVSRLLGRLIERGLIRESASPSDGRAKILSLSEDGKLLLEGIDRFADRQVAQALTRMPGHARAQVVGGLLAYADALEQAGTGNKMDGVDIAVGYRPGCLGRIAEMHGDYYARAWQFPPAFEARVAAGLADFVPRLDRPANRLWLALQGGRIKGSAAIDGEDLGSGKAHLRWVIVESELRGSGVGHRLVSEAIGFCEAHGFAEIHLWTFRGLDAARKLYEALGFSLAEEWTGNQWGRALPEQRFVRRIASAAMTGPTAE